MKTKRGAPKKPSSQAKGELLQIRLSAAEKQAFSDAATLAGQALSVWIRDQLRRVSQQRLQEAGRAVPFLESKN